VIAGNDPQARAALVAALVSDAHRLLGHLPEQQLGPREPEAVALLALVAGQDVEPVEDTDGTDGRWRIARKVAEDRVSPPSIPTPGTRTRPCTGAPTGSTMTWWPSQTPGCSPAAH